MVALIAQVCSFSDFQEALAHIPKDAVTVEIAPHALLQSILKRSLSAECLNIGLQKRGHDNNLAMFYQGIGKYVK